MHTETSLAKPFAAFGAAAGLFAILGLGAFRDAARAVSPIAPMLLTAAVGAAAGEVLRRWRRLHGPLAREAVALWVGLIAIGAGAASGGLVALVTWGWAGVPRFVVGGAAVGVLFAPPCLVIFDAARRASRARLGSLVADADRRTVHSTVLAGIAFASAAQLPALLAAASSDALGPRSQLAISAIACVGANVGIVLLQRSDRRGRAVLAAEAAAAGWLEEADDESEGGGVDLGLGEERWARASDAHYRASGRPEVVLRGSLAAATAAFDEGDDRRHHARVVAVSAFAAVAVSALLRLEVLL